MANKSSDFLKNKKQFIKSPLGIIAMFISLIYALASLLLGFSGNTLQNNERFILLIFIVSFPVLVLIAFLYLVANHPRSLFGPADFKDERNFLKTIDSDIQRSELNDNVISIRDIDSETDIRTTLETSIDRFKDYLLVENLVLRKVEKEYNLPLRKYVKFDSYKYTFDCILEGNSIFIASKIKYIRPDDEKYNKVVVLRLKRRYRSFQKIADDYFPGRKRIMIFYIVYKNPIESFKNEILSQFEEENNLEVNIRFLNYDTLIEQFLD